MFSKAIWPTRSFYGQMTLFYLVMLLFYSIMQQNKMVPTPLIAMQVGAAFLTYFFSFLYSKKSIAVTCVFIFIFQIIASFGLRYFNIEYFNNPLGYKPADALAYHEIAVRFMHSSLREFNMFMENLEFMIDDLGMNYICHYIYKLGGTPDRALNLMVFFNVCCITVSTYFCYKLANLFVEAKYANFAAFIWGTQLYATYTAASGLKENFMVMLLLISIYYIASLYSEFNLKNLTLAVLFAFSALFFRLAIFYMLLVSILAIIAMKYPLIRKYIYFLLAAAVVLTWLTYQRTFNEMTIIKNGSDAMDYDTYQNLVEAKMDQAGVFASIVSYLSALIGPLPNIVATGEKSNYITLFSFSSLCKSFYAFYFIYAIYKAVKDKHFSIIAILIFWFLEIVMLLVTFFTLHDRYHWPHLPIVIILSVWGGIQWHNHKHPRWVHSLYVLIVIVIITIFNFR